MKKFALLSLSAFVFATVAQATTPMPSPILTYSKTNGAVSPPLRKTVFCKYKDGLITKFNTGPAIRPVPRTVNAQYTATVKNMADVRNLLRAASNEKKTIDTGRTPVGGGVLTISGNVTEGSDEVFLRGLKASRRKDNASPAAQDLIEFVLFNCEKQ